MSRSREIYHGHIVTLALHDVRLPDGSSATLELVEHAEAAAVVALDEARQVLLVRQYRIGADRVLYEIPAGVLEVGEAPDACAVRELREEVGFRPGRLEPLGGFYPAPGYTTEFIHIFLAGDLIAAPLAKDEGEFIDVVRVPLLEALAMVDRQEIIDGKSIIGLLKSVRRLGLAL